MPNDLRQRWTLGNRTADEYDATYDRRAAAGERVHGEANFVQRFEPKSVLDAGCGTGRVGRELARRGVDVVGVDLDEAMLTTARSKAPDVDWRLADLADVALIVAGSTLATVLEPTTHV